MASLWIGIVNTKCHEIYPLRYIEFLRLFVATLVVMNWRLKEDLVKHQLMGIAQLAVVQVVAESFRQTAA